MTHEQLSKDAIGRWNDESSLTRLPGEYDLNFRVSGGVTGILKIMRENCDREFIETQVAMMNHLARVEDLPVPHIIPSASGDEIEAISTNGDTRLAWMISLLPGETLANAATVGLPVMRDIGIALGRVHLALQNFRHEGLERDLKWDLLTADRFEPLTNEIEDPKRAAIARQLLTNFRHDHQPFLKSLARQALHNDLNDHNILVTTDEDGNGHVSGLLDFGDIVYGPVLADVSIAGAYFILDCDNPVDRLAAFLGGYLSVHPLSDDELDAVWPLALTRLAASVTNAAVMKKEKPDDPYVVVTEGIAWRLLDRLEQFDEEAIRRQIRQALNTEQALQADSNA